MIAKHPKKRELRLETQLASSVWRWLNTKGAYPIDEFQAPWGITDFFGIRPNLDRVLERTSKGQTTSVGGDQHVMILLAVPALESGKSIDQELLAKRFSFLIGKSKVEHIIQTLRKRRFLKADSQGQLTRDTPWLPFHDEMWSVELKLTRVNEALAQAKRHLRITPNSFVGLPPIAASKVAQSAKANDFIRSGVGLLSVTPEECVEVIKCSGDRSPVEQVYEVAAAENCWRQILKAVQH